MARSFTVDDYFKGRKLGDARISPNGKQVVYVLNEQDLDENCLRSNLHLIDVESGKGFQLTNGFRQNNSPLWSPDGAWIAFISDRTCETKEKAGEPKSQIWLIRPNGGEAEVLTQSKSGIIQFKWSPTGDRVVFLASDPLTEEEEKKKKDKEDAHIVEKDIKRAHVWSIDPDGKKAHRLTRGRFHVVGFDGSPNGRQLVYAYTRSPLPDDASPKNLALISTRGGQRKVLVQGQGFNGTPTWSPDGKMIAFFSTGETDDLQAEYDLWVTSVRGGQPRCLVEGKDLGSGGVRWSPDSRFIFYEQSSGVHEQVNRVSVATGQINSVLDGDHVASSFSQSKDGKMIAWVRENGRQAPQVFVSKTPGGAARQLSRENEYLKDFQFGKKERVRWQASDGLEIEGLLIKPVGYKPGTRYPLLTVVHGGPAGCFSNTFEGLATRGAYPLAVFAQQGYAVLLPNPRGSHGYGAAFRRANYKDWGGGDYGDIMTGVDAVIDRGIAHPDRLGIMGWSYGGYMTAWVVTQTTRFRAASVGAGITNLYSMYGSNDMSAYLKSFFGDFPWRDPVEYAKHSAISFMDRVKTPVLIQHGEQDRRVPYAQALEFHQALKDRKVPVEFVSYPRQGHGITEPRLRKDALKRNLDWFNRWIKGKAQRG